MKINEVDLAGNAPEGKKNDPKVLMRNPQIAKMSQLAVQNFQGYLSREMQRRQAQGDSAEISDQDLNNLLTDYTEQILLKDVEQIPQSIKSNINTIIDRTVNQRDNSSAMKQNFLQLVANTMSARFSVTNVFATTRNPKLKIKAGTTLNTEEYGEITFDGTNWKNDRGEPIGRKAVAKIMGMFEQ